jgi:hypothetical protein
MSAVNIAIAIILIVIIYYVLSKTLLKTNIVYDEMLDALDSNPDYTASSGIMSSNVKQNMIPNSLLSDNGSTNFMVSVWFYIDNWGTNIGEANKNILFIGDAPNNILHTDIATANDFVGLSKTVCGAVGGEKYKSLSLCLDKYDNNLFIDIATHTDNKCKDANKRRFTRYAIENIPIQKWNCLTISIDSLLMDVYLDGKLINSFILHGVYKAENEPNIYLGKLKNSSSDTLDDGFAGFITRVRFEGNAINSQEALNIYKAGINSSLLKSVFNKYSLKVSFLEYNKEKGSFKI